MTYLRLLQVVFIILCIILVITAFGSGQFQYLFFALMSLGFAWLMRIVRFIVGD